MPRPDMVTGGRRLPDLRRRRGRHPQRVLPGCRSPGTSIDDVAGVAYLEGPRAGRARRPRRRARRRPGPARPGSCPRPSGWPTCCRRCARSGSTSPSPSTSTAAPPAWSPSEDLLEELVEEITDEYDVEAPLVDWGPDGVAVVAGVVPVDEVNERLSLELPEDEEYDSVGGFVLHELGRVPTEGESVEHDGARLVVDRMRQEPDRTGQDRAGGNVVVTKSGFCTIVGRPNVGKSTLLNQILGSKVSIVSDKPQTTRTEVRGDARTGPTAAGRVRRHAGHPQAPDAAGERLNDTAHHAVGDVDVVIVMVDATAKVGRGDGWVAERVPKSALLCVNKVDLVSPAIVAQQLADPGRRVRARRVLPDLGPGPARASEALVEAIVEADTGGAPVLPGGHRHRRARGVLGRRAGAGAAAGHRPGGAAALDRHPVRRVGVARVRIEILVEQESQKGIVIGKGGAVLKGRGDGGAGPAPRRRLRRAVRQGRQGLATPSQVPRTPRLLKTPFEPAATSVRPGLADSAAGSRLFAAPPA